MTTPQHEPTPMQVARMRAKIAEGIRVRERRGRVRRRVAVGVSLVAVASLVTGGVILATLPETSKSSFVCYTADDLGSEWHGISYPMDLEPPTAVSEQITWALDLCVIARDSQGLAQPADPVVCRLPDLRLGVFPNGRGRADDELCDELGLLGPRDPIPGYETPTG
jgi:hypothetical protein